MNKFDKLITIIDGLNGTSRKDIICGMMRLIYVYEDRDAFNDLMFKDDISQQSLICMFYKLAKVKSVSESILTPAYYSVWANIVDVNENAVLALMRQDKFAIISYIRKLRDCEYMHTDSHLYRVTRSSTNKVLQVYPDLDEYAKTVKTTASSAELKDVALTLKCLKTVSTEYMDLITDTRGVTFEDLVTVGKCEKSLNEKDLQNLCIQFMWAEDKRGISI